MMRPIMMTRTLHAHWWTFLLRGIAALIFAAACVFLTGATIYALVLWIGIFFIVDGAIMLWHAIRSIGDTGHRHWWWLLLGGLVGIAAGALTLWWPGITALTLALFIGWWALVTGVLELIVALRFRNALPNEWMWVIGGILTMILGALMAIFPAAGLVAIVWMIGFYAFLAGISLVAFSIRLYKAQHPA